MSFLAALMLVTGTLPGADGVSIFYRKVGRGPEAVVYIHGGPGSNFRGSGDEMDRLGARRTLIMYDQRGSGRSQVVTDPQRLTAEDHVRDLEALRKHLGLRTMTLVGLSWGSGLAALYAAQYPDRVSRMILVSPMPITQSLMASRREHINALIGEAAIKRRAELAARLPQSPITICRELIDINFRAYLADPTPAKLRKAERRCDIPPAAILNRAVVEQATFGSLGNWDFHSMLREIRVPTLVVEGAQTSVPLEATREWATTMPNARFVLIPDAGHELFLDQPKAFLDAAEAFLDGR